MFQKVLVAIDLSDDGKRIFEHALTLTKALQGQLMIVHVLSPFDDGYPSPVYPSADGVYPVLHEEALESYIKQLETVEREGIELLKDLSQQATHRGVPCEFSQVIGNPGQVICKSAQTWHAELIILGRRGRTGLSELFLGSVSNYVMHHASCSVLTIQGDETPVVAVAEA